MNNAMQQVVTVALNQAPDVTRQFVLVREFDSVGWFLVWAVLMVGAVKFFRYAASPFKDRTNEDFRPAVRGFAFLACLVCAIAMIGNVIDGVEALVAPKAVAISDVLSHLGSK